MIIDKKVLPYVVYYEETIQQALQKINLNTKRLVYCISESGVLEGLVTDGDFRRWVVSTHNIDLQMPIKSIANTDFVFARDTENSQQIEELFSPKITAVPIIDGMGRLSAIAWQDSAGIRIGDFTIREDKPAFIIAEIGNNHNGSLELAKRLIDVAASAGANCAKFQLRDMESLYLESVSEDLGSEYTLDLLKRFQLSPDEMFEALDYVTERGLVPLCTPWDLVSLKRLTDYGLEGFKISSADLTNHELVRAAARTGRPLILSTGMSLEQEIIETVKLLRSENSSFALLQCNSTYPAPFQDINLAYMDRLAEISRAPVGYSGHERGYAIPVAAVARGAKIIEKHFTIDRDMEGNDHRVSLLPHEFSTMVDSIRNVEDAIGTMAKRQITQGERLNREVLAKSLVAKFDIAVGETITESAIDTRSPGSGLQPSRMQDIVGVIASRTIKAGDVFFESDVIGGAVLPRAYKFDRPWGIPVRYHDIRSLITKAPLEFVEIHFSYRDLDLNVDEYFDCPTDIGLVVHSPELFSGDHLMDLSSFDEAYRTRSVAELQRVIDRTRELKKYFPRTHTPLVIVNAGGFTSDRFMPAEKRQRHYELVGESLASLDAEGVEIIPQTMPPFPWHFGGQRFHNLFVDPDETADFCEKYGVRTCFDISHSQLACNYFGWSMRQFVRKVGPYTAHLHIVDAKGDHDEGLQIGVGDIDFEALGEDLREYSPEVPFIPEIWQGHKNGGEGFWIALDKLESRLSKE
jgi:N-acetylneuraminate synthase